MPTILDVIIILAIATGAVLGFKKGVIRSAVEFIGTLAVLAIAYYLKNPLSELMYTNLPFFNFSGAIEGVTVLNIIIYEIIAYLICILFLWAILRVVVALTGLLEAVLKMTIVLSIPSKFLGIFFGLAEAFVVVFVALFCINQVALANNRTLPSNYADDILNSTPLLSDVVEKAYTSVEEIIAKAQEYENITDKNEYNKEALDILLKNKVITSESAQKLVDKGKLKIDGIEEILTKYKGE